MLPLPIAASWWFFVPCALSVMIVCGLFVTARRPSREFACPYPGGPRIGRGLFVGALRPLEGRAGFSRRQAGTTGWVWYTLPAFRDGQTRMGVELCFRDGALWQISLFHDDPAVYGESREDGPAHKEQLRLENTVAWLRAKGFRVGSHPWGEIWADRDPRSDFGSIGIRYALASPPRADLSVAERGSNPWRVESPAAM